jgi:Raf kinase inhibitor-like YbhB/YbcL family protein
MASRVLLALFVLVAAGCKSAATEPEKAPAAESNAAPPSPAAPPSQLSLVSPAFSTMGPIPRKYTCEGSDTSPPLDWSSVPEGTKSLALIIDDPDVPDPAAPTRVFVHWVVYNLPPDSKGLPEGAASSGLPRGAVTGKNDWGKASFGGSCPPIGRHRYFHKLYALDTLLDLGAATKAELETAMQGHVLGKAELVGTYEKGQ